jgi:hypothetical protein
MQVSDDRFQAESGWNIIWLFKKCCTTFPLDFFAQLRIVYSFMALLDGPSLLKIGFTRQALVKSI